MNKHVILYRPDIHQQNVVLHIDRMQRHLPRISDDMHIDWGTEIKDN
jgi:hypothetical protein